MEKRRTPQRNSIEAELESLTAGLEDDEEVVFLQQWDQPTRRHKTSGSWGDDRKRRNRLIVAGLVAVMLLSGVGLMAVAVDPKGMLPEQLYGVWRTATTRYADAALGLQSREIAFYNGRGIPDKYRIDAVTMRQADTKVRYIVDYSSDGKAYTIEFLATRDATPTIQLVSRPEMRWTRGNVLVGKKEKSQQTQSIARADTTHQLTPLSPEFVACIKAASRARAAGQEPVRCTRPEREARRAPVATVARDTTVSLMEDLGAQRRNR